MTNDVFAGDWFAVIAIIMIAIYVVGSFMGKM